MSTMETTGPGLPAGTGGGDGADDDEKISVSSAGSEDGRGIKRPLNTAPPPKIKKMKGADGSSLDGRSSKLLQRKQLQQELMRKQQKKLQEKLERDQQLEQKRLEQEKKELAEKERLQSTNIECSQNESAESFSSVGDIVNSDSNNCIVSGSSNTSDILIKPLAPDGQSSSASSHNITDIIKPVLGKSNLEIPTKSYSLNEHGRAYRVSSVETTNDKALENTVDFSDREEIRTCSNVDPPTRNDIPCSSSETTSLESITKNPELNSPFIDNASELLGKCNVHLKNRIEHALNETKFTSPDQPDSSKTNDSLCYQRSEHYANEVGKTISTDKDIETSQSSGSFAYSAVPYYETEIGTSVCSNLQSDSSKLQLAGELSNDELRMPTSSLEVPKTNSIESEPNLMTSESDDSKKIQSNFNKSDLNTVNYRKNLSKCNLNNKNDCIKPESVGLVALPDTMGPEPCLVSSDLNSINPPSDAALVSDTVEPNYDTKAKCNSVRLQSDVRLESDERTKSDALRLESYSIRPQSNARKVQFETVKTDANLKLESESVQQVKYEKPVGIEYEEERLNESEIVSHEKSEGVSHEKSEGVSRKKSEGVRPDESEGVRPEESEDKRPDESEGVRPEESEGVRPEESEGIRPEESEGIRPEDSEGVKPEESEDVRPEESEGVRPEESEGVRPEESEGVRPEESEGIKPEDSEGTRLDGSEGVKPDESEGVRPDESEGTRLHESEGTRLHESEGYKTR